MLYKTLHAYILRELLRVFLLTASTLTTLLAFGGMFRPLTKQGVDISQVMSLMLYLMPAMLAYAIPIAALFAAVLVYWRMSTDNELTACRAGGVSFMTIAMPAFILGVAVASVDLVFVNYVVPRYLLLTERSVRSDVGSLIVSQINRQEKFQYESLPIVVTADFAEQDPSPDPNVSIVRLHNMAGTFLDRLGKPTVIGVAQEATVTIRNLPDQDTADVSFSLINGSGFDPANGFRKATGSFESLPLNRKFPSFIKSKAKFLNFRDLKKLDKDPSTFPPVAEVIDKIEVLHRYREMETNVQQWWAKSSTAERGLIFNQATPTNGQAQVTLFADQSQIITDRPPEECLTFSNRSGLVKVVLSNAGRVESTYRCEQADMILAFDQFTGTTVSGQLRLHGSVKHENNAANIREESVESPFFISGLSLPAEVMTTTVYTDDTRHELKDFAYNSPANTALHKLGVAAQDTIISLDQNIISELHSRASFALSCLTLVMLGAALGILLRGKNPLAVFVMGFVPAILLVLLITAGRQLTESGPSHTTAGVTLIWAGNAVLLAMVAGVYATLLRR